MIETLALLTLIGTYAPGISLADALSFAEKINSMPRADKFSWVDADLDARVEYVNNTLPLTSVLVRQNRRIEAIKGVRDLAWSEDYLMSLMEAKNIVDEIESKITQN